MKDEIFCDPGENASFNHPGWGYKEYFSCLPEDNKMNHALFTEMSPQNK